jgi:hypothetical protein
MSVAGKLPRESVTIPSIVRKAQSENSEAFIERVRHDEDFVRTWLEVVKGQVHRKRKPHKELIVIEKANETPQKRAAQQTSCPVPLPSDDNFSETRDYN